MVDISVVRSYKKNIVRHYRLLFNSLNGSLSELTSTLLEGKGATTALSNDILETCSIGEWAKTLGLTHEIRGLLEKRLEHRVRANKAALLATLESLRESVREMHDALYGFREGVWEHLEESGDSEKNQREYLRDVIMCSSLTHRQVCTAVGEMVGSCEREVEDAKALVVRDFVEACDAIGSNASYAEKEYWELRVLAWMTEVHMDKEAIEGNMAAMAADAGLAYFSGRERS